MLIKELQSLALDVRVIDENGEEIDLKQDLDEETNPKAVENSAFPGKSVLTAKDMKGFTVDDNPENKGVFGDGDLLDDAYNDDAFFGDEDYGDDDVFDDDMDSDGEDYIEDIDADEDDFYGDGEDY